MGSILGTSGAGGLAEVRLAVPEAPDRRRCRLRGSLMLDEDRKSARNDKGRTVEGLDYYGASKVVHQPFKRPNRLQKRW